MRRGHICDCLLRPIGYSGRAVWHCPELMTLNVVSAYVHSHTTSGPAEISTKQSCMPQGVPVRIEVGPRDVEQGTCVAARRDRPGKEGKQFGIPLEPQGFVSAVEKLLDEVQVCYLRHERSKCP